MAVAEQVKRVFSVQEERKQYYERLKKAQRKYLAQSWSLDQYQGEMTEVTAAFSTLSKSMIELAGWFRNRDRREVTEILEGIQQREKEKLQLTVKFQVKKHEHQREQEEGEEGEGDFRVSAHEERELRRQLAEVEEAIAGLMRDLRFECESELLTSLEMS